MARYKCPSCGAAFNGKKCKHCLYEQFTEEFTHGLHTHEGEPLVVNAPARKPIRSRDPFGCEKKSRKRSFRLGPAILAIVLAFSGPILSTITNFAETATDSVITIAPEPEPEVFIPEDALVLHDSGEIAILADWQDGQKFGDGFDIYIRNNSSEAVGIVVRELVVNGCLMENDFFYCEAYAGKNGPSFGRSQFTLDEEDLAYSGVKDVQELSLRLEALSLENYRTFFETDLITLNASVPEDAILYAEQTGLEVYAKNGIRVLFQGFVPGTFDPEAVWTGKLLFYIENNTDQARDFYASEVLVNGEASSLSFWTQLPPHTRTVTRMYLYDLEDTDIQTPEELKELTVQLEIANQEDYADTILTDPVTLPVTEKEGAL